MLDFYIKRCYYIKVIGQPCNWVPCMSMSDSLHSLTTKDKFRRSRLVCAERKMDKIPTLGALQTPFGSRLVG